MIVKRPKFPKDCIITNLRQGKGCRKQNIYAELRGPDDTWLITATLEYINKQLIDRGIEE